MRKISFILSFLLLVVLANLSWAGNIGNKVYGIDSETFPGVYYDDPSHYNPSDKDGGHIGAYSTGTPFTDDFPTISEPTDFPKEGSKYRKIEKKTTLYDNSMYMQFGHQAGSENQVMTDMNAYKGGKVCFWVLNDTTFYFQLEWGGGGSPANKSVFTHSTWTFVSYNLDSFVNIKYSSITVPGNVRFIWKASTGTVCIDNLVWISSTPKTVDVTLKNISNNVAVSSITWSNVVLGAPNPWKACDQYIQLDLQNYATGWAIQIYTDNLAADATPQFQQISGSDPAGLVDLSSTTVALPMCWRIVDITTNTYNMVEGTDNKLYSPDFGGQAGGYKCFLWMKDKNTAGSNPFVNGEDYVITWEDFRGMHHAEDLWGAGGGSYNPNYIYLGAKFQGAAIPRTYRTSKLIIELFYE